MSVFVPRQHQHHRRLSGAAYWDMLKRTVVVAGAVNVLWLLLYGALGAPLLAMLSLVGVASYALAHWALERRRNRLAAALIWAEVLGHATIGSLLVGWDSGFHYFLMLFIPALVVGTPARLAMPLIAVLLAVYAALHTACNALGPLQPLGPWALATVHWVNVASVFFIFYAVAAFYRWRIVRAERELLRIATVDPLTGLANRSQFHLRAEIEVARSKRQPSPMALVLADVDHFKRINDECGHDAGDQVLVRLADLMRQVLRDGDVLARWGGEEFLALLPGCDISQAHALAERLRRAVAAVPIEAGGRMLNVTMSFGIAGLDGGLDVESAIQRADRALYRSKHAGRNRATVFAAPDKTGSTAADAAANQITTSAPAARAEPVRA